MRIFQFLYDDNGRAPVEKTHIAVIQVRHYSTHQNLWFPWLEKGSVQIENSDNGVFRLLPAENKSETYICPNKITNEEPFTCRARNKKNLFRSIHLVACSSWQMKFTNNCCGRSKEFLLLYTLMYSDLIKTGFCTL